MVEKDWCSGKFRKVGSRAPTQTSDAGLDRSRSLTGQEQVRGGTEAGPGGTEAGPWQNRSRSLMVGPTQAPGWKPETLNFGAPRGCPEALGSDCKFCCQVLFGSPDSHVR